MRLAGDATVARRGHSTSLEVRVSLVQALLLGVLQGATEFLPVSSSGHLVIVPYLLDWPAPDLALGVILHLGTLLAILVYFYRDLLALARAAWFSVVAPRRGVPNPEARLAWGLILGTLPAALVGVLFASLFDRLFAMPRTAALFLLGTAALLTLAEFVGRRERELETLSWTDALVIGLSQALATLPGISRSGATIATGLVRGFTPEAAARFSFLLAVPIMIGSGSYELVEMLTEGGGSVALDVALVGCAAAAVTGYAAIAALLSLVRRSGLLPFAAYCALFGIAVLVGVGG
jgi:undecaprenyl-diphosphatase